MQSGEESEMLTNKGIEINCDIDDVLNYAIYHNGAHIVRDICVKNISENDIENLTVKIDSYNELVVLFEFGIQKIQPGEELHFKNLKVGINADYLVLLTERSICKLRVEVYLDEEVIASEIKDITVFAFDQWPGLQYTPELLSAFVMPNHPVITNLLQLTSQYLDNWTSDPSLAGYQFKDINRVKTMAAAAYAAIQKCNITYAEPPSSFEYFGQRIRLADSVLEHHMGTCMDMTLLYVACLEAMGLNPIMIMKRGHIFAGVWLIDESFADMIMDDPSQLEKRMSKGINELIVVECTAMCAGKTHDFDDAINIAERHVSDYENFAFVIDVVRARSMGIRPLPVRIKTDAGFEVQHEDRKEKDITGAPTAIGDAFDLNNSGEKKQVTKQMQWERKLLDLSMRNMLINMRLTKGIVPLLSSDVGILEDALAEGAEFKVLPRPADMSISSESGIPVEALGSLGSFAGFIELESKRHRLHSLYTEKELSKSLTSMYRSAKTSMEENGASTLYLALGLLRWFEDKKSELPRYAPVVLVPIDIKRKSASEGYTMHMRDEDAQINITLLEFLKQNFEIHINGLNPVPVDEHGIDMPKIFAIIRHSVMNMHMWDVIEAGFIGNFSFSQFVMWNDIHNRAEFLENNKIVRGLMNGTVDWDCTIPDKVDTDEAYLPVTVDSSQLRAINMAAEGVSFVLHGPPGTGKSQTITAMIANALTKGKTVLFVAEKMAALEVVEKRLASLGIQHFCMELHSNKATKKAVLDQLKRGLELSAGGKETDYDKKIQDIRIMRANLDAYSKALHVKRPFGKSLRQLMDLYEMVPVLGKDVRFDHTYVNTLTENNLEHQIHSLEQLIAAGKVVGHPHNHPLAAVHQTEYSQRMKFDLENMVIGYKTSLEKLMKTVLLFSQQMELENTVTKSELKAAYDLACSIIRIEEIPDFLRNTDSVDREFYFIKDFIIKRDAFASKKEILMQKWNEHFLLMDMSVFKEKYDKANRKFLGKGKAIALLTDELQAYSSFRVETDKIPAYLTEVTFYKQELGEIETMESQLPYEWKALLQKYPTQEKLQQYQQFVEEQLQTMDKFAGAIRKLESCDNLGECVKSAKYLGDDFNAAEAKESELTELLKLVFDDEENWIDNRLNLCHCILDYASSIKDWIVFKKFEKDCRDKGLGPICDAYIAGIPHDQLKDIYLRSIYKDIILSVIENEPVLNGFTGTGFNERILQFKKLDQEFIELTKEEMYYVLTHQLPTGQESVQISKELNILRRAISSNGRGMSIRTLFEQIPNVLSKLCPCMLMSPISVAQYLAAENDLFDIVVFDEASQLPTCKAVGVLARGHNAVVVGDPNQMPPTSFFSGNTVDEDNLDIEDLDSILNDCLALGIPQTHLHWHYRSKHESLIAFSNKEFYENSMLTFPSVNDRKKCVNLIKVDGFFDRGKNRVNEGEAKAILEEIKRRYRDDKLKNHTIGVVTFNISQQSLIEDLLQEEYQKDKDFDNWANIGEETMFVKNLENVQGDERDVILFSVAFGPDSEGKLSLNFGPLNKDGGWKRLNVAVSRARLEMLVFTTMTSDMIDLRRTRSKGVESLKNFLSYSEKGRLIGEFVDSRVQQDQGIMEHICEQIEDAGYKYQKAVGHSKFKLDIAVINPYKEEAYLLGIMLDGESYRRSINTKDREIAQISLLEGLGWRLHRVWTMDWWDNREKEISKLLQTLEQEKAIAYEKYQQSCDEGLNLNINSKESINETKEDSENVVDVNFEAEEKSLTASKDFLKSVAEVKNESDLQDTFSDNSEENRKVEVDVKQTKKTGIYVDNRFAPNVLLADEVGLKVAAKSENPQINNLMTQHEHLEYKVEDYVSADVEITPISTADYILKDSIKLIAERIQIIIDMEAPINHDQLVKKVLRSFDIGRSSTQTIEATEKALKTVVLKSNKQAGTKFYWGDNQDIDEYRVYRSDANSDDKRSVDDICQQELKNAICVTLHEKGPLDKDSLIKETIRTMGYARSGVSLVAAVDRGLKFGRKTGEIVVDEQKAFAIRDINNK